MDITDYPHYERFIKDNSWIKTVIKNVGLKPTDDSCYWANNQTTITDRVKKGYVDIDYATFLHLVWDGYLLLKNGNAILFNKMRKSYVQISTVEIENTIKQSINKFRPFNVSPTDKMNNDVKKNFENADLVIEGTYFDFNFDQVKPGYLNITADTRCKIVESKDPQIIEATKHIDTLLASIGGERGENIEYLERALLFKHRNPGSTGLPLLMVIGKDGSNGKKLLCRNLCSTICGKQYVSGALTPGDLGREFNSRLQNKLIWHFDEVENSSNTEKFYAEIKRVIGNDDFTIMKKYHEAEETENTALPIMTSNCSQGPIRLNLGSKSGVQRRFGVIICSERSLIEIAGVANENDLQPLVDALANPKVVGHWLWTLGKKHDISTLSVLSAHQGRDYDSLVREQNADIFEIIDELNKITFTGDNFLWLSDILPDDCKTSTIERHIKNLSDYCKKNKLKIDKYSFRGDVKQKRAYAIFRSGSSRKHRHISG